VLSRSCESALRAFPAPPLVDERSNGCKNARMVEQSIWMQKVSADPGHSHWSGSDFIVTLLRPA